MSIKSLAGTFSITNRLAQLDLYLSVEDQVSIIGEREGPEDFRTWIFERIEDGYLIKSKVDGLYIGFRGLPMPGTKLVVGNRDLAKVWDITRDEQGFKIRLANFEIPFVMEFPSDNLQPGTPAQLGLSRPMPPNQSWIINPLN